ncbi:SDR family oxidoreductase [bacterium]|nr:SDR family oxidoreductase [bacterium]
MTENKAALITGGAKRLGRAIAVALAEKGFNIALHYNRSRSEAEQTSSVIGKRGVRCELFQCDLEDQAAAASLFSDVRHVFPNCTCLVNSASVFERRTWMNTDPDFFDRIMNINFRAPLILSQAFAQSGNSGVIINLLDTKIAHHSEQFFMYTLSKKCLAEFTRMCASVAGPGIRVNGICPGMILPSEETSGAMLDKMAKKIPLQKRGEMQHVVKAVLYLIENEFVTGDFLFVDGGEHL